MAELKKCSMHRKVIIEVTKQMTNTSNNDITTLIHYIQTPKNRRKQNRTLKRSRRFTVDVIRRQQLVKDRVEPQHKTHKRRTRHLKCVTEGSQGKAQLVIFVPRLIKFRRNCGQIPICSFTLTFHRRHLSTKTDARHCHRIQRCQERQK